MTNEIGGPPFTVERYGSLGESIIAERDWLQQEIERLTRERDEYKVWWERDSTSLGKALNEVSSLRASNEQLHAAVKTAQELAATRLMEVERLNLKCGALAFLQYGSSGPDDPWQAKLDEVTKPLHADIEHLTLALVQQEGVLNECEALLRQALDEGGVNTDFAQRLYDYWKKSSALTDWRTRDMLIAARHSHEPSEQRCNFVGMYDVQCGLNAGHEGEHRIHGPSAGVAR